MSSAFAYWDADGNPVQADASGVYANATTCGTAPWVSNLQSYDSIGFYVASAWLLLWGTKLFMSTVRARQEKARQLATDTESGKVKPEDESPWTPVRWACLALSILVQIFSGIYQGNYRQGVLTVLQQDAISNASNFLIPLQAVFQFFEDGMTVRISAAMGAKRFGEVGRLYSLGVRGGVLIGSLAAVCVSLITFSDASMQLVLPKDPGESDSCAISPAPDAQAGMLGLLKPYWIFHSLQWPASFAALSLVGVFMGTACTEWYLLASVLQAATSWAALLACSLTAPQCPLSPSSPQQVADCQWMMYGVGLTMAAPQYVFLAVGLLAFSGQRKYRNLFQLGGALGLSHSARKELEQQLTAAQAHDYVQRAGDESLVECDAASTDGVTSDLTKRSAKEGALLMMNDLSLSLQASIASYLAGSLGVGAQYRLTVLDTVSGNFNRIFTNLAQYTMRITGAAVLAAGKVDSFKWLLKFMLKSVLSLAIVSFLCLAVGWQALPAALASRDVCRYQMSACGLSVFDQIYDGIEPAYAALCLMAISEAARGLLRAACYATLDFSFVAMLSLCSLLLFIPMVLVSYLGFQSVNGFYICTLLISIFCGIAYARRLKMQLAKQPNGM